MIIRDLYRCPTEDLHKAIAASPQAVLHRGVAGPASSIELADVERLVAYPSFDPALSFVAFDGGEPAAFLVSRIEGDEAVWSLFGGSGRAPETLLDEARDHWRREGAKRARKGATGLLASEPRLTEDAELVDLLKDRDFEIQGASAEMTLDLKKLAAPKDAPEREADLRQKGYSIRSASPEEVAIVARQYQPRHTGQLSQEFWNFLVRHLRADAMVVAELRRQLVGYAAYLGWTLAGDCPQLGPHFVDEVHRKAGLGPVLVHHAVLLAKETGRERVKAWCGPADVGFYERAGFAVAARFCHDAAADLT